MDQASFDKVRKAHFQAKRKRLQTRETPMGRETPGATSSRLPPQPGLHEDAPGTSTDAREDSPLPPECYASSQARGCVVSLARMVGSPNSEAGIILLRDAIGEAVAGVVDHMCGFMELAQVVRGNTSHADAGAAGPSCPAEGEEPEAASESAEDLREQVRYLRKQIVRSAIKQGNAALKLAEMRKTKDRALESVKQDIAATENKYEVEIDRYRARAKECRSECRRIVQDKHSHLQWVQEGLVDARAETRWLRKELRLAEEARESAVGETQQLQTILGGENEKLRAALSAAQGRYSAEMGKNAALRAELERAEAVVCGLQKQGNLEITGLRSKLLEPATEEPETDWDSN